MLKFDREIFNFQIMKSKLYLKINWKIVHFLDTGYLQFSR